MRTRTKFFFVVAVVIVAFLVTISIGVVKIPGLGTTPVVAGGMNDGDELRSSAWWSDWGCWSLFLVVIPGALLTVNKFCGGFNLRPLRVSVALCAFLAFLLGAGLLGFTLNELLHPLLNLSLWHDNLVRAIADVPYTPDFIASAAVGLSLLVLSVVFLTFSLRERVGDTTPQRPQRLGSVVGRRVAWRLPLAACGGLLLVHALGLFRALFGGVVDLTSSHLSPTLGPSSTLGLVACGGAVLVLGSSRWLVWRPVRLPKPNERLVIVQLSWLRRKFYSVNFWATLEAWPRYLQWLARIVNWFRPLEYVELPKGYRLRAVIHAQRLGAKPAFMMENPESVFSYGTLGQQDDVGDNPLGIHVPVASIKWLPRNTVRDSQHLLEPGRRLLCLRTILMPVFEGRIHTLRQFAVNQPLILSSDPSAPRGCDPAPADDETGAGVSDHSEDQATDADDSAQLSDEYQVYEQINVDDDETNGMEKDDEVQDDEDQDDASADGEEHVLADDVGLAASAAATDSDVHCNLTHGAPVHIECMPFNYAHLKNFGLGNCLLTRCHGNLWYFNQRFRTLLFSGLGMRQEWYIHRNTRYGHPVARIYQPWLSVLVRLFWPRNRRWVCEIFEGDSKAYGNFIYVWLMMTQFFNGHRGVERRMRRHILELRECGLPVED